MTAITASASKPEVRPIDRKLFILSDVITQFAAGMVISATAWFVFDQTHSSSLVAGVSSANTIGGIVVTLAAGLFIDRYRPKLIALASHAVRVTFMSVPLILFLSFGFHPLFAFILALDNGIGWNLYFPASKTIVQRLSGPRGTAGMNSIAEVSMQIGLFSAGAVSGVLYRSVGFYPILLASALIMCLGMLILSRVHVPEPPEDENDTGDRSLRAGIDYVRAHPKALLLSLVLCAPFIVATVCATALPGYANVVLGTSSVGYGLIGTAWGAGACIAGLVMSRVGATPRTSVVLVGMLALAAYAITMTVNSHLAVAIGATVFAGMAAAAIRIVLYTETMSIVSSRFLGRVLTIGNLISLVLQTILSQSTGLLMDATGARYGYLLVIVIAVAFSAVYLAAIRTPRPTIPALAPMDPATADTRE